MAFVGGNFGIGTSEPATPLHVLATGEPAAIFRRSNDGILIELWSGNVIEGSISINGHTTSYNAFTGSHYAKSENTFEKGMLMKMTGQNNFLNDNPESEIIYSVELSTEENSGQILGAYLAKEDTGFENSPELVMAVGNGVMWVIDDGENLKIGDYLISSSVPGHAVKDAGKYEVANIIARVAEPVNWDEIDEKTGGKKHALVSVFFENFQLHHYEKSIERLEQRILELEEILKSQAVK